MDVKAGYKQTEVGVIPEDWHVTPLAKVCRMKSGESITEANIDQFSKYPCYGGNGLRGFTSRYTHDGKFALVGRQGALCGNVLGVSGKFFASEHAVVVTPFEQTDIQWLTYVLEDMNLNQYSEASAQPGLSVAKILNLVSAIPPSKQEQEAIAEALSDADALIAALEQLLAKKRQVKQGAIQELLAGKIRLPGFSSNWEIRTIEELTDSLDNLRVPLNEIQRAKMQGDYPYCGANGILDYVNDYVVDENIILMAEDGGYFDEYAIRPIAYKMSGKCWVNNHAHILKAKENFNQDFIFYSLVHKNILPFIASGTRAKLNKFEMFKIEISIPPQEMEQTAIAEILSDMDAEIAALEAKLAKARQVKQGMMQEILTGRVRLV